MADPGALPFSESDIRQAFSTSNVLRGERYAKQGRVAGVVISNAGSTIAANVRGSRPSPYVVTAYATRRRGAKTRLTGYCNCPIGADCKHVAAAFFAAIENIEAPAREERRITNAEDARVDLWLNELRSSVRDADEATSAPSEVIAYIFESMPTAKRDLGVRIVVANRSADGRLTSSRDMNAEALGYATVAFVQPSDVIIGRLLQIYSTTWRGRASLAQDIVRRMIASGFAFVDALDSPPLRIAEPRRASIAWDVANDGTQRATLAFDDETLRALPTSVGWYFNQATGDAGPADAELPAEALATLLDGPPLAASQIARVRDALAGAKSDAPIPAPLELTERIERLAPIPTLRLRGIDVGGLQRGGGQSALFAAPLVDIADLTFAYGAAIVSPRAHDAKIRHLEGSDAIVYVRDTFAETIAAKRLAVAGLEEDPTRRDNYRTSGLIFRYADNVDWQWSLFLHEIVPELRAAGWNVEIDESFHHRVVDLASDAVWHPTVRESSDGWFDLALGIDIEGKRYDLLPLLANLLEQSGEIDGGDTLADGRPRTTYYVSLGDESPTLALPYARVKAIVDTIVELREPGALGERGLRVPRVRAGIVNELEAKTGLKIETEQPVRDLADRLRSFKGLEQIDVPAPFEGTLRPYQRDGLNWLQFLAGNGFGGILADDMGLGKSVQTLAHLLREKDVGRLTRPALLVVPTSLVYNWRDEAARFTPSLRVLSLHGSSRAQRYGEIANADVVITTYALLVRDRVLFERTWHTAIFDEAQMLKNPLSKVAKAAREIRAEQRLCLTGTPVENNLGDLWSLFAVALPQLLGERKRFNSLFRSPIEKRADATRSRALAQRIAPFLMRRTKEAVAPELPEKTEIVQRVELTGAQRDLYETVRVAMSERVSEEIAANGIAKSQIVILDALLKLRQVCCDPRLLPDRLRKEAQSVKLEMLLEMLPAAISQGSRILLFSQFTSMLDLIGPALDAQGIAYVKLTGESKDRESIVKRFQAGEVPVFLVSLKAGGTGLNLTAADTVIHYDPWWNPAVERQATDRAHRIGQTRPVFVYKLICAGTVEEKIVALQTRKAELADAIFSETASTRVHFDIDDIKRLFAPIDSPN